MKTYKCGYKHCVCSSREVKQNEAVKIGARYFHKNCALVKQNISVCANRYVELVDDRSVYPQVVRVITTLVVKNLVPINFIQKKIKSNWRYYKKHGVYSLYYIRTEFWEKEMRTVIDWQ